MKCVLIRSFISNLQIVFKLSEKFKTSFDLLKRFTFIKINIRIVWKISLNIISCFKLFFSQKQNKVIFKIS